MPYKLNHLIKLAPYKSVKILDLPLPIEIAGIGLGRSLENWIQT